MERSVKGIWIPIEVWNDERLTMLEKGILAEIDSLDGEEHCYATNEYLASFCGCSERIVSSAITKLISLGYITKLSFNGRTRVLASNLHVVVYEDPDLLYEKDDDFPTQTDEVVRGRVENFSMQSGTTVRGRVENFSMQTGKNFHPHNNSNILYNNNTENIFDKIPDKIKDVRPSDSQVNQFDVFWNAYPRKVGKKEAAKSFAKALEQVSLQTMLDALEKQKMYKDWCSQNHRFVESWPHPSTWLNGGRWEDDAEIPETVQAEKKIYDHDNDFYKAAEYLDKKLVSRYPELHHKEEYVLQEWAEEFELCESEDGYNMDVIEEALMFSQKDAHWQNFIKNPRSFRKNIENLIMAMKGVRRR